MNRALSLVELSIVLVILGLLTGGVLAGKSLIRASELRSVTSDYQRYVTATHSFRDRFFAMPGDMANAESFWGQYHATASTCQDGASTTAATCNGDGDGYVEITSTRSREIFRFWQHLANAGVIEGQYIGTRSVLTTNWFATPGTNIPASKIAAGAWWVAGFSDISAWGGFYSSMFPPSGSSNWLIFGGYRSDGYVTYPILKSDEAWNIDAKLDDGMPGTGKVTTFNSTYHSGCASSSTASTATYVLSNTSQTCAMMMGL